MQYKIPIQIENEDTIVAGLSLRQLGIIAAWGGVGYTIFNIIEPQMGSKIATVFAAIPVIIFIIVALVRISEMTFLPALLNFFGSISMRNSELGHSERIVFLISKSDTSPHHHRWKKWRKMNPSNQKWMMNSLLILENSNYVWHLYCKNMKEASSR